ncbi:MAG: hypothetical protein U5L04_05055 [Trueperaceae bacterium]|nr:hypothetical protein [Trueperaceae bacterium]
MKRLEHKFNTARSFVPKPVVSEQDNATVGILAFGSTHFAIEEARDRMLKQGLASDFMRLRALPLTADVKAFVAAHDRVYVIELNRDAQIHTILQSEMPELATKLVSLAHLDGMPLSAKWVVDAINTREASARKEQ